MGREFSQLTPADFVSMNWGEGKLLRVCGTNGSDSLAVRGTPRPFRTLTAAKNAAISGDTILVYPGTYTERDLLKNGVNWHFMAGAVVVNDVSQYNTGNLAIPILVPPVPVGVYSIFSDRNEAIICSITGDGEFRYNIGNGATREDEGDPGIYLLTGVHEQLGRSGGLLYVRNPASKISLQFKDAYHSGFSGGGVFMIWVEDCDDVHVKGRRMDTANTTLTSAVPCGYSEPPSTANPLYAEDYGGGIWWSQGDLYIDIDVIRSGNYTLYPNAETLTAGSKASNIWVRASLIEAFSSFATIYTSGSNFPTGWRIWIDAQELKQSGAGSLLNQFSGRCYVRCMKASSNASVFVIGGGGAGTGVTEAWLDCQKITAGDVAIQLQGPRVTRVWAEVKHIESNGVTPGSVTPFIHTSHASSKLVLSNAEVIGALDRTGVQHSAGISVVKNVRIDTTATNDVDNKPVIVGAAGLILDGCTLLAPALADSIYAAAAQTVKIYGTTFANKAKHANVTVQAGLGTLVADSNVT